MDKIQELQGELREATKQLSRIDFRLGVYPAVMFPLMGILGWYIIKLLRM